MEFCFLQNVKEKASPLLINKEWDSRFTFLASLLESASIFLKKPLTLIPLDIQTLYPGKSFPVSLLPA